MFRATAFAVLILAASSAHASDEPRKVALAEGDFAAQRAQIEKDLADGETYVEITHGDRAKVRESLGRISGALEGVESVEALSEDVKARVFNDQEQINQILTSASEDSRMICRREAPTGSNRKTTTCLTAAERRRRMELDQDRLQRNQRGQMPLRN